MKLLIWVNPLLIQYTVYVFVYFYGLYPSFRSKYLELRPASSYPLAQPNVYSKQESKDAKPEYVNGGFGSGKWSSHCDAYGPYGTFISIIWEWDILFLCYHYLYMLPINSSYTSTGRSGKEIIEAIINIS